VLGGGGYLRSVALVLILLATATPARAQVHWDAGAQAGVMKRFAEGSGAGAGFGPMVQLQGHVALLPMVRLGAYLSTDLSPIDDGGPRTFWEGGIHLRVSPPLLAYPWRTWVFAGFGYAYAYDLGARLHGGQLDVPVGLGVGRKLSPAVLLFSELGARFGFAFDGAMYDQGGSSPGKDPVALSLSVGLSLEE
jgi:hypothetical protein